MNPIQSRAGKALLLGVLLSFSVLAQALPSPKEIEAEVRAGHFEQAEIQLRQVIAEKPSSAKAHYELGQVLAREGRYIEAEQELRRAQAIDPALKFASSPQKFDELLAKVGQRNAPPLPVASSSPQAAAARAPAPHAAATAPAAREESSSLPWGLIALVIGGIALFVFWMRRAASSNVLARPAMPASPAGFGHSSYSPAPNYHPGTAPGYGGYPPATPAGSGMGSAVTGAVVGGLAGMAAGYALSKALEDDKPHAAPDSQPQSDFIPMEAPRARPDFGDFDTGSGDDWDTSDTSSSGDSDNW